MKDPTCTWSTTLLSSASECTSRFRAKRASRRSPLILTLITSPTSVLKSPRGKAIKTPKWASKRRNKATSARANTAENRRKTGQELAAEKRERLGDRFKAYQDRATKKLDDRRVVKLKTKPLNQLKDQLKRISEDFNFNFREIDVSTRTYLGKLKLDKEMTAANQKPSLIINQVEK
mmetsp:Transcript_9623/g.10778  ORF Transcript_9623/g.10778 Transcript_9623/m.10778 type:complete len:176 (+) Transcript_9623:410-937(+)